MKPGERATAAGAAVVGAGAAAGAATAAACCVAPVVSPLIVATLGVGGSVAVAGLAPYTPYLLLGSLLVLGGAFRLAYRRPQACAVDEAASVDEAAPADGFRPTPPRWLRVTLWGAAVVWLSSLLVSVFVPR